MQYTFSIVVYQDEDGKYVATCPYFKGCHSQGKTFDEAVKNIEEVITMCIEEYKEEGKKIPEVLPKFVGVQHLSMPR